MFMHDNDPKHTAKSVKKFLSDKKVNILEWPAQSPDLNPIENLWAKVQEGLRGKKFKNAAALFDELSIQWAKIPLSYIQKLVESLPNRCRMVIKAKGANTKY